MISCPRTGFSLILRMGNKIFAYPGKPYFRLSDISKILSALFVAIWTYPSDAKSACSAHIRGSLCLPVPCLHQFLNGADWARRVQIPGEKFVDFHPDLFGEHNIQTVKAVATRCVFEYFVFEFFPCGF